jgi:hypothetical protein
MAVGVEGVQMRWFTISAIDTLSRTNINRQLTSCAYAAFVEKHLPAAVAVSVREFLVLRIICLEKIVCHILRGLRHHHNSWCD